MTLALRKAKKATYDQNNEFNGKWQKCGQLFIIPLVLFSLSLAVWATYYVAMNESNGPYRVNGQWGKWMSWSSCSESCGGGVMTRSRLCANPLPRGGGQFCEDPMTETRPCNSFICDKTSEIDQVTGRLDSWLEWSQCSKDCGGGIRNRTRHCIGPMGAQCHSATLQQEHCNSHICPIIGYWTIWSSWTLCTKTCDSGKRFRYRECTKPQLPSGEHSCQGIAEDEMYCSVWSCPQDGQWTEWIEWTDCTATCGGGYRQRSRTCDDPSPSLGGIYCTGKASELGLCGAGLCE